MVNEPLPPSDTESPLDIAPLQRGIATIAAVVETLPLSPGVYRMLNAAGDVLYVGKARQLKRRVANYTHPAGLSIRIQRMVAETRMMEIVLTHTEAEALLLESNLIKKLLPRYNVLLRDDKGFPHILLTGDHPFPQLVKHRGARNRKGEYFGPFAAAHAVTQAIIDLQRVFLLRNCSDAYFAARKRPCLQYQIKRCSGPCVGRIDEAGYGELVNQARLFLTGRSSEIQGQFAAAMQAAADQLDYETAARYRDRLRALTSVQAHQDINVYGVEEADVFALAQQGGQTCIQVFFFRSGANYGNRAYYPSHDKSLETSEVLASFIGQFYADRPPPLLVLLSEEPQEAELLAEALTIKAGRRVALQVPKRGDKRKLIDHAATNAREALARRLAEHGAQRKLLEGVATLFDLPAPPERIEVYDNSHISGTNALGGMIVAGPEGFHKQAYRKFNIRGDDPSLVAGDDYGMMREVLRRRFGRALREDQERQQAGWPDLVLIDGGAGQLSAAMAVMAELGLQDLPIAAIAKGPDRNAGRERFFLPGREPFSLEMKDPVLYYLQRLRDEAHRYAIDSHRARRTKALGRSELDDVPGIGAARRKALLHHFGSVRAISRAGIADLQAVSGISATVAKKIYDHFHSDG